MFSLVKLKKGKPKMGSPALVLTDPETSLEKKSCFQSKDLNVRCCVVCKTVFFKAVVFTSHLCRWRKNKALCDV